MALDRYVTRRLRFCAAHRVLGHEKGCQSLHGHNFELFVGCSSRDLDSVGRVIDFKALKTLYQEWVDQYLDHASILCTTDPLCCLLDTVPDQKLYRVDFNPTVENLITHLYVKFEGMLFHYNKQEKCNVVLEYLDLHETENCSIRLCQGRFLYEE